MASYLADITNGACHNATQAKPKAESSKLMSDQKVVKEIDTLYRNFVLPVKKTHGLSTQGLRCNPIEPMESFVDLASVVAPKSSGLSFSPASSSIGSHAVDGGAKREAFEFPKGLLSTYVEIPLANNSESKFRSRTNEFTAPSTYLVQIWQHETENAMNMLQRSMDHLENLQRQMSVRPGSNPDFCHTEVDYFLVENHLRRLEKGLADLRTLMGHESNQSCRRQNYTDSSESLEPRPHVPSYGNQDTGYEGDSEEEMPLSPAESCNPSEPSVSPSQLSSHNCSSSSSGSTSSPSSKRKVKDSNGNDSLLQKKLITGKQVSIYNTSPRLYSYSTFQNRSPSSSFSGHCSAFYNCSSSSTFSSSSPMSTKRKCENGNDDDSPRAHKRRNSSERHSSSSGSPSSAANCRLQTSKKVLEELQRT